MQVLALKKHYYCTHDIIISDKGFITIYIYISSWFNISGFRDKRVIIIYISFFLVLLYISCITIYIYIYIYIIWASGTGVRQSQARLEKPNGTTRQGCVLGMSVSRIVHDRWGKVSTQLSYTYRIIILV